MTDEIDLANERAERWIEDSIRRAGYGVELPAGQPGECDFCGEWSGRLVGGACAPCRDKLRLP